MDNVEQRSVVCLANWEREVMLQELVVSPKGAALDRFLARRTGYSLTVCVFAFKYRFRPGRALFLETTGRRSGRTHGVALPYFLIDGKTLIVGSNGGLPKDTHWVLNLRATPEAFAYIKGRRQEVRARFTEGEERARYWEQLKARIPNYREYERLTTREIPVIALDSR
ncbi:hypothetical protein AU190_17100 [Mycolicibacterium acapulense]|nr:hypothetical protein AU189_12620 [Mycolicibacterium acapulense]KUI03181.1 hypothetical protein AU190_17100 [Mycolicibacterium acapulense]